MRTAEAALPPFLLPSFLLLPFLHPLPFSPSTSLPTLHHSPPPGACTTPWRRRSWTGPAGPGQSTGQRSLHPAALLPLLPPPPAAPPPLSTLPALLPLPRLALLLPAEKPSSFRRPEQEVPWASRLTLPGCGPSARAAGGAGRSRGPASGFRPAPPAERHSGRGRRPERGGAPAGALLVVVCERERGEEV
jgi:hypothetical protein